MSKRRVLITGGSRGIGLATAELFRSNGYVVVAPPHQELDLSSPPSVRAWLEAHGDEETDILINNAGINIIKMIDDIEDQDFQQIMTINLLAPLLLAKGVVGYMRRAHFGRIVNIGSIWCEVSKPGRTMYSMTKYGLHGMTKALASELAPDGILVNTVCPGFTMTELTARTNTQEQIAAIEKQIPMLRLAEPSEIAKAVFFAGSEENTYMTGQKIIVDGGYTSI